MKQTKTIILTCIDMIAQRELKEAAKVKKFRFLVYVQKTMMLRKEKKKERKKERKEKLWQNSKELHLIQGSMHLTGEETEEICV